MQIVLIFQEPNGHQKSSVHTCSHDAGHHSKHRWMLSSERAGVKMALAYLPSTGSGKELTCSSAGFVFLARVLGGCCGCALRLIPTGRKEQSCFPLLTHIGLVNSASTLRKQPGKSPGSGGNPFKFG